VRGIEAMINEESKSSYAGCDVISSSSVDSNLLCSVGGGCDHAKDKTYKDDMNSIQSNISEKERMDLKQVRDI